MKTLFTLAVMLLIPAVCDAQITVTGLQERIPMQNAELRCAGITISRAMQIDSVSGFHNGFWIVRGNKAEKAFWTEKYVQNAIGYILRPGTYYVYPNLRQDIDTASVTIWLKNK